MSSQEVFLSFTGPLDYKQIDGLLVQLRESGQFRDLEKITGKRVYSVLVESLENIINHSAACPSGNNSYQPSVSVREDDDMIVIKTGNLVAGDLTGKIDNCLKKLNSLNNRELAELYEENILKQPEKNRNGSGLGCILMRRKSGHDLQYSFKKACNDLSYFELRISIDKYHEKVNY